MAVFTLAFTLAFHPSLRALPSHAVGSPVISTRCVRHAAHGTSRSVLPQAAAASVAVAEVPLLTSSNLDAWERIDDVIMGGVSSSQLVADGDAVSFEGTLREEGGGFCGQRLKLLTEPLDLSAHDGLYVDCEPEAECLRRVWKLTCRVAQDRGEVVYQALPRPQPNPSPLNPNPDPNPGPAPEPNPNPDPNPTPTRPCSGRSPSDASASSCRGTPKL